MTPHVAQWPLPPLPPEKVAALPRISVVTPNFNYAASLERTIQSVLMQGYPNLEYIVIDGGSTDGSREVIERYSDQLAYWVSEPDKGQYDAINKGFARATGDILCWLNSDDVFFPWTFRAVAEVFTTFPEVEWITGITSVIRHGIPFDIYFEDRVHPQDFLRCGLFCGAKLGWIQQESTFWRSGLWRKAGGLDCRYSLAADFALWATFARFAELVSVRMLMGGFSITTSNRSAVHNGTYHREIEQFVDDLPEADALLRDHFLRGMDRMPIVTKLTRRWNRGARLLRIQRNGWQIRWDFPANRFLKTSYAYYK